MSEAAAAGPPADVLVVGAGPAGLATAACLGRTGRRAVVLERAAASTASWRRHYPSLRLHTLRRDSGLPFRPLPAAAGRYPSRDDLVAYLDAYAAGLDVRLGTPVAGVRRAANGWEVATPGGPLTAATLVLACGDAAEPLVPDLPGQESFGGEVLHSGQLRDPAAFRDSAVVVAGFGNSGADLAAALAAAGARVTIAQRGPVFLAPLEVAGRNWLRIERWVPQRASGLARRLDPRLGDAVEAVAARLWHRLERRSFGDLERLGLRLAGPAEIRAAWRASRPPVVASPIVPWLRDGKVSVVPAVTDLARDGVRVADGRVLACDALVLATGWRSGFAPFLGALGLAASTRALEPLPGLFLCGRTALLAGIARDARRIAAAVLRRPRL